MNIKPMTGFAILALMWWTFRSSRDFVSSFLWESSFSSSVRITFWRFLGLRGPLRTPLVTVRPTVHPWQKFLLLQFDLFLLFFFHLIVRGLKNAVSCKIHVKKLNRKMLLRPNICYIFEKLGVQGCHKWHSHVSIPFKSAQAHSTRPHNAKKLFMLSF